MEARKKKYLVFGVAVVVIAAIWTAMSFYEKTIRSYPGEEDVWVLIPHGADEESIRDSLKINLGSAYGDAVYEMWRIIKGHPVKATGAYKISNGDKVLDIAKRIKIGDQTPIRLTFNNVRLYEELPGRIAEYFDFTPGEFKAVADTLLPSLGYTKENFIGAFMPDSYEFYWSSSPKAVIERLLGYKNKFWNDEKKNKAKALGLTPEQVVTLASIVEEETARPDEYGTVARLYLNRLKKGMRLQADPTVKFAVGDFTLKRILNVHLAKESPYNTYLNDGLPPGPIRMPEKRTIDAVLNAPVNDYLYMCAKEDFSGRHNFATNLAQHNVNAQRYRQALDRRGIK